MPTIIFYNKLMNLVGRDYVMQIDLFVGRTDYHILYIGTYLFNKLIVVSLDVNVDRQTWKFAENFLQSYNTSRFCNVVGSGAR